jgi:hypothetical protein
MGNQINQLIFYKSHAVNRTFLFWRKRFRHLNFIIYASLRGTACARMNLPHLSRFCNCKIQKYAGSGQSLRAQAVPQKLKRICFGNCLSAATLAPE